jgi:hypothetical protein
VGIYNSRLWLAETSPKVPVVLSISAYHLHFIGKSIVNILIQLVQIGGIGGSLAFLLLGYYLLSKEQDMRDAQGNRLAPRPEV